MLFNVRRLAVLSASLGLTTADCRLSNGGTTAPASGDQLCLPQSENSWTFSMYLSEVDVFTFDGGDLNAGNVKGNEFIINDNACNVNGTYGTSPNSDCGVP